MLVWQEMPLGKVHDRKAFDCGDVALNSYLQKFARRNHDSGVAKTFVTVEANAPNIVLGFYALSPASIDYARTTDVVRRGLDRYGVTAYRLGRLAVATTVQGRGLGGALLLAAGRRCRARSAGSPC